MFGVQGNAAEFVQRAIEAGHPTERDAVFRKFRGSGEISRASSSAPGDLLLVKGSRGVKMEKILEAIEAGHRARCEIERARAATVGAPREGRG